MYIYVVGWKVRTIAGYNPDSSREIRTELRIDFSLLRLAMIVYFDRVIFIGRVRATMQAEIMAIALTRESDLAMESSNFSYPVP